MIRSFGTVLMRRARMIGERRAESLAERMCTDIGTALPDIVIRREHGRIRLFGRRLRYRWLTDAALRWLGRLLR